jgi:succinate dehydrogenase / fumarate reductase membrane anchor subunit
MAAQNNKSFATINRRIGHLGTTLSGTGLMWGQRVTSVALMILTVAFVFLVWSMVGKGYTEVRQIMSKPLPAVIMLAYMLIACYHMMLGIRVIIDDYVPNKHAREWSIVANILFCGFLAFLAAYAILRIGFV